MARTAGLTLKRVCSASRCTAYVSINVVSGPRNALTEICAEFEQHGGVQAGGERDQGSHRWISACRKPLSCRLGADAAYRQIALDETVLDAAKSSIVFGVAKSVSTPGRAALMSFINQGLKGVSQNFNVELLEKFQDITKDDVLGVLKQYFLPLFDSASSVAVIVTAPSKAEQVAQDLGKVGFDVEQKSLQVEADEDSEDSDSEGSESDSASDR